LDAARYGAVELTAEAVDLLVEESIVLHHVIDDLRDLAAADAGSLRVHREHTYVRDLLLGRPETEVEVTADPDLMAYVDPVRMRQMVGNLVSNALRHTPPGGRVSIRARIAGERLIIEVADTGEGIAPGDLPKVFDRFWRADGSR